MVTTPVALISKGCEPVTLTVTPGSMLKVVKLWTPPAMVVFEVALNAPSLPSPQDAHWAWTRPAPMKDKTETARSLAMTFFIFGIV